MAIEDCDLRAKACQESFDLVFWMLHVAVSEMLGLPKESLILVYKTTISIDTRGKSAERGYYIG